MRFDENYFKGEEREGFYVKPMMKRAWAAQLEVLQQIDEICQRNHIEYYASSGTLLGAIRHGGFIPWDDDLDIEMKRLDYERFLKIVEKELPQEYEILNSRKCDGWDRIFSRVINTMELPLRTERLEQFHGFPYSAGVDIFPIDYLPVNKSEEKTMMDLFRTAYMLSFEWDKGEVSEEEKMQNLRAVENYCNIQFTQDKPYRQQLLTFADQISAMYWDTDAEAEEATMVYMLAKRPAFRFPVSCYENTKRVPFENSTIPIPCGYEQILTACFGNDYMTPKQGLADHEYPFYKIQQELLLEYCKNNGIEMPKELLE